MRSHGELPTARRAPIHSHLLPSEQLTFSCTPTPHAHSLRRSALVCRAAAPGPNAADASLAERCARGAAAAAASLLMAQASRGRGIGECRLACLSIAPCAPRALHCCGCPPPPARRADAPPPTPPPTLPPALPLPLRPAPLQSALAGSFTFDELQAKSYLEVKGSTLANQCSSLG